MRTIVTFQSEMFNSTEHRDYFINECCFGDDLAKWLIGRLNAAGIATDAEPGQEDFGWYFGATINNERYHFLVGHRPADGNDPETWIAWVKQQQGLIKSIFGQGKERLQIDAVKALHHALQSPEIKNVRWHRQEDFDKGIEENSSPTPGD